MAPRARLIAIAAACWLLMLAGGARAVDDHGVSIKNTSFTDSASGTTTTTIVVGDSVTWHWDGAGADTTHTVTSDNGSAMSFDSDPGANGTTSFPSHSTGDTFKVTFPTAGTFTYHCKVHPTLMKGTISVVPPSGGGGGGGGGNGPPPPPSPVPPSGGVKDRTAPSFSSVKETSKKLVFSLSEPSKVTIKVRKGRKVVKTFHMSGKKGSNSFKLSHRGLKSGVRYKALISAVDGAGNKSASKSVTVKV
ncbi:MAG TPA: plastocyanin/azurin family copper-binding protein [Thermoleophilaceae bacterium]|jgi:plastocyanin